MDGHRLNKYKNLIGNNIEPYIDSFKVDYSIKDIRKKYDDNSASDLISKKYIFRTAGRVISMRKFGKASFLLIKDRTGQLQAYIKKNEIAN